jgi:alginate O-acetyltransferase complex protein AlgI
MMFTTYTYAVFLPIVWLLFLVLPTRGRQVMLLIASYVFYCWEKPIYGVLLFISTLLDYLVGLFLGRTDDPRRRKLLLACSVVGNLGMLGFFKYGDFVGANLCGIGRLLGFETTWEPLNYLLPVGISFYTFQTMSYSIQVYRRQQPVTKDLLAFALYVTYFPQLVAGPIERATNLLPQLLKFRPIVLEDITYGLTRILFGIFRKLVIADRLAILVNAVFNNPDAFPRPVVWMGVFAFGAQIYFDFAGYADIAIGSARLFGVRLTENFNRPLLARSIADFWNRWHMTLTSFLRDYLFYPLGGFRKGGARAALNAMIVLLLCGLWHGAQWHFVLWGGYHALLLTLYYMWVYGRKRLGIKLRPPPQGTVTWALLLSVAFTYFMTSLSAVLFRSTSLPTAWHVYALLFGLSDTATASCGWYPWLFVGLISTWLTVEFCQEYLALNERIKRLPWWLRAAGMALLAVFTLLSAVNLQMPYIYFQF